mgnify:CR=1 FL=1
MSQITLEITPRTKEKKVKDLREQGTVPCVLYGHEIENQQIECDEQEFHKTFVRAGESTIIDLDMGGKKTSVLIHKIDRDPVTDRCIHIDFFAPNMKKEITTHISIVANGEVPAVKELGGVLVTHRDSIEVRCLPKDLPHEIVVDLSKLAEIGDSISVSDLSLGEHVAAQLEDDEIIFAVEAPRKEEVVENPAEGEEGEATEEGEKKEGEAAEEGEKKE